MNKKNLCKSIILFWLMNPLMLAYAGSEPPASHLSASELLKLYSSMYSSIHNMSVSYSDVVDEVIPDPKDPNAINKFIRYFKVERIEEGDKYYIRYSYSNFPSRVRQRDKNSFEYAFDGSVTMEYCLVEKSGSIEPGRTNKISETLNHLLQYMLRNDRDYGAPAINFKVSPDGKVRPHLEQISGQWCHVVDTIRPPLPGQPKGGRTTIWFAADKGGLPMKFEEYDGYGKLSESIFVDKVAAVDDKVSKVWYPRKAKRTTYLPGVGTMKHKFVCHKLKVNIETNKDTWKVSFPEGTRVYNHVSGISYNAGPSEKTEGN